MVGGGNLSQALPPPTIKPLKPSNSALIPVFLSFIGQGKKLIEYLLFLWLSYV